MSHSGWRCWMCRNYLELCRCPQRHQWIDNAQYERRQEIIQRQNAQHHAQLQRARNPAAVSNAPLTASVPQTQQAVHAPSIPSVAPPEVVQPTSLSQASTGQLARLMGYYSSIAPDCVAVAVAESSPSTLSCSAPPYVPDSVAQYGPIPASYLQASSSQRGGTTANLGMRPSSHGAILNRGSTPILDQTAPPVSVSVIQLTPQGSMPVYLTATSNQLGGSQPLLGPSSSSLRPQSTPFLDPSLSIRPQFYDPGSSSQRPTRIWRCAYCHAMSGTCQCNTARAQRLMMVAELEAIRRQEVAIQMQNSANTIYFDSSSQQWFGYVYVPVAQTWMVAYYDLSPNNPNWGSGMYVTSVQAFQVPAHLTQRPQLAMQQYVQPQMIADDRESRVHGQSSAAAVAQPGQARVMQVLGGRTDIYPQSDEEVESNFCDVPGENK